RGADEPLRMGGGRAGLAVLRREDLGLADLPLVLALAAVLVHDALAQIDVFEEARASALRAARRLAPDHLRRRRRRLLFGLDRCHFRLVRLVRLVLAKPGHVFPPSDGAASSPAAPALPTVPMSAGVRAHSGQSTSEREPQR